MDADAVWEHWRGGTQEAEGNRWSSCTANPVTVGAVRITPSQSSQESMPVPCSLEHPACTLWEKAYHLVNEALSSLERPLFL